MLFDRRLQPGGSHAPPLFVFSVCPLFVRGRSDAGSGRVRRPRYGWRARFRHRYCPECYSTAGLRERSPLPTGFLEKSFSSVRARANIEACFTVSAGRNPCRSRASPRSHGRKLFDRRFHATRPRMPWFHRCSNGGGAWRFFRRSANTGPRGSAPQARSPSATPPPSERPA